ncbi:MAG: LysM peptidoglycan-binding domain-containing protein [Anaerolineae bacterium]|nr:LysM peptidoglycan-binding domain-containing protein [Anaerolineae bacterium]
MIKQSLVILLVLCPVIISACALDRSQDVVSEPTAPQSALSIPESEAQTASIKLANYTADDTPRTGVQAACTVPAGWRPYQLALNETIYSLAARANVSVSDLLASNCLTTATGLRDGSRLYVPPETAASRPQTSLPLGISALVANPGTVPAGGLVTLAWQAQGPVVHVRLGWVYRRQFIEQANGLPPVGVWQVSVPTDGRESITFEVRISDGIQEIAAQTTVQVMCPESWFFTPTPSGCPSEPLVTTFHEQRFESGTIVYVPALGVHYVLPDNQPAALVQATFVPGMPLKDAALDSTVPAGMMQPVGPINYAWGGDEKRRAALGYAIGPETRGMGMLQRTVSAAGETVYFSVGSGQVIAFADGQAWQIITPE